MAHFSKVVLITGVLVLSFNVWAQTNAIPELRSLFYSAWQDGSALASFRKLIAKADTAKPVVRGYQAMVDFMAARHENYPPSKLRYFITGKRQLEAAIEEAPMELELRFLRFAVQSKSPRFLGYWGDINADKQFIIGQISELKNRDQDLFVRIAGFMLKTPHCTTVERKNLKRLLKTE